MNTLGIDLGGTKTIYIILDSENNIVYQNKVKTEHTRMMADMIKNIQQLQKEYPINRIGIGSAGRINPETGEVFYATDNLPGWTGTKIKERVEKEFSIPCYVENDVNCTAYSEYKLLKDPIQNMVCLTIGTGLGGAIIYRDRIMTGSQFSSGEYGHMILYPDGKSCNCGKKGCWEQYVSGSVLNNRYHHEVPLSQHATNWPEDIFKTLTAERRKIVSDFIHDLGVGIISIQNTVDPQVIVLGGGVTTTSHLWLPLLESYIKENSNLKTVIKIAETGELAGAIGAAFLAKDRLGVK